MKIASKRTREEMELFHSYLVDSRGIIVNKSNTTSFESQQGPEIRLFTGDLDDPRRTNMERGGCLTNDDSFHIKSIKLEARFSSHEVVPDFIRMTSFRLHIGDKLYYTLEANILSEEGRVSGYCLPGGTTATQDDNLNTHLTAEQDLRINLVIPPCQGFYAVMTTFPPVVRYLRELESGAKKGFVEIRFSLCGERITHEPVEPPEWTKPGPDGIVHMEDGLLKDDEDICYPTKDGMPLTNFATSDTYRGHGTPDETSVLDEFSMTLLFHLRAATSSSDELTSGAIKRALQRCMNAFPTCMDENGFFTIPPEDTTEDAKIDEIEDEPGLSKDGDKAWNPADYLSKKPKS